MNSKPETISTYFFLVTISLTVLFFLDLEWRLRFSQPALNYLYVMLLSLALPVSSCIWAHFRKSLLARFFGLGFSLLLSIPCLFSLALSGLTFSDIFVRGYDSSFETIDQKVINESKFVLYRTNGGATTAFGLRLQQEIEFSIGLKLVKTVHNKYRASEASLEISDGNILKLTIQPYSEGEKVEVLTFGI